MSNNFTKIILFIILSFCFINAIGQVENIKKNIEKDKSAKEKKVKQTKNRNVSTGERTIVEDLTLFFFEVTFRALAVGAYSAQTSALKNHTEYRQRVSFELRNSFGAGAKKNINYLRAGARLNWGIIASDFKYTNLYDVNNLKNLDWSVAILRLPIQNVNLEYGVGFIKIMDPKISYFKSLVGLEWNIKKPTISFLTSYQWTEKKSLESRYIQSFNSGIDFKLMSYKKLHFYSMFEYSYQNYFDEDYFSIYNFGLVIKIF